MNDKKLYKKWKLGQLQVSWGSLEHIKIWRMDREEEYKENKRLGKADAFDVFDNYNGPGFSGLLKKIPKT